MNRLPQGFFGLLYNIVITIKIYWNFLIKRMHCALTRHQFIRYFTMKDSTEIFCTRCEKYIIIKKDAKILSEDFFD